MQIDDRTTLLASAAPRKDGRFVLYWMEHTRRLHSNFALDRAIAHAVDLQKPLVVAEVLRLEPGVSTMRSHQFVLDGMRANAAGASGKPLTYLPFVELSAGDADEWLAQLAAHASVIVTDVFPTAVRPLGSLPTRVEAVDSCGIVPLSSMERAAPSAYVFRRWAQRVLQEGWRRPLSDPLADAGLIGDAPNIEENRWSHSLPDLKEIDSLDRIVGCVDSRGGAHAGADALAGFVSRLQDYPSDRNHPDKQGGSLLSPYLHHGHVAATDVVDALLAGQQWSEEQLGDANGKREGWWGLDPAREAFLDQLVVWRELGFHFAHHVPNPAEYDSLPPWALETLDRHSLDARPVEYSLDQLEGAATHDPIWNAAQRELLQTGRMHNYMRMLWGKKILEWSPTPREAFDRTIYLNDRWALDGRDPNSYSGVGWVFGRFDRPWGPRREIFGTIRYMSSDSAKRKLRMKQYLDRFSDQPTLL